MIQIVSRKSSLPPAKRPRSREPFLYQQIPAGNGVPFSITLPPGPRSLDLSKKSGVFPHFKVYLSFVPDNDSIIEKER